MIKSLARFFSRVDVCENEVYCKKETGESARYMQAAIESPTLRPKLKQYPTQYRLDDCAVLED
jgi:hypothetical protein